MKRILLILLISAPTLASAQAGKETQGTMLFNRGLEYYKQGKFDSALVYWTWIVNRKIDTNFTTYGSALFNIPTVYWRLGRYDKAMEWYKKVLASDLQDKDETGQLMEPHTNYKHQSAVAVAGLYAKDSNFGEALRWVYLADTVFRYWGSERRDANAAKQQAYLLDLKTGFFLKQNRKEEAVREMVTELICAGKLTGFFVEFEDRLLSLVDKRSFKEELDKALQELAIKPIDRHNWVATFRLRGLKYSIYISNLLPPKDIPHYWKKHFLNEKETPSRAGLIGYIKSLSFYKKLTD
jgi:tetratricopeptide (TPR) repeat protein